MEIDFSKISAKDRYKLLVGAVVPRPIALVSTRGLDGKANIAPFSFFNAISDDPPGVAIGVNASASVFIKDTARNIRETGEFVVNLVDERLAPQMDLCGAETGPDLDEFLFAGLTAVAGHQIRAPRVAESPISLECRRLVNVEIGIGRNVVIGQVVHMSIRDDLIDSDKLYVLAERAGLIARMHGLDWYAKTDNLIRVPRATPGQVAERLRKVFGAPGGDEGRVAE